MFQYTTETIINSNSGKLPGNKRFGVIGVGDAALISDSSATGEDFLVVDGVNTFKIKYIKSIYKTAYRASQNEVATFTFPSVTAKEVVRVAISLREEGSVRASMQDAYLRHRKPFFYEIVATGTPATDAAALVSLINKDMREKDEKFFKAEAAGATVTLTASDCYIRFVVDKFNVASVPSSSPATNMAGVLLGFEDYNDLNVTLTISTPGDEGQGTVTRLVKNLRIPTNASINPFAADQGGKPIPGGEYDQYLIEYETPRAHVSGTVVGSVGEVSRTSHVFFIENKAKQDWEKALALIPNKASIYKEAGRSAANANLVTSSDVTSNAEMAPVGALKEKSEMGSVE
jgi:hypothetical protein